MNFRFELKYMNKEEIKLIPEFCKFLLKNIQSDIENNISHKKFNRYEKYLLTTRLISWKVKPQSINIVNLCYLISKSFVCTKGKNNSYSIHINRLKRMPNTKTQLSKIARLLDKGNDIIPGTLFISTVINKYIRNINKFWELYVTMKLGRVKVSKCIKIE